MKTFKILVFNLLLFSVSTAYTQDIWSLEKCIIHAMDASILVNQAELGVDQSAVNLNQSRQDRLPNLSGGSSVGWNFGRSIDPTSNEFIQSTFFANGLNLNSNVVLFNGNRINNTIKQSNFNLEAAKADLEQTQRDIALTVATNYLNVLFAKENIAISQRQLELNQQQLEQTSKQISAGALPESERLNLEAQVAQSEQALIVAKNNLDISMLQLKQVLRLDPSFPLDVEAPESVDVTTDPELVNFEEAFIEAQKNRPDLFASEWRVKSADLGIKIAKSQLAPSVFGAANLRTNYSNQARELDQLIPRRFEEDVLLTVDEQNLNLTDVPATIATDGFDPTFKKPSYDTQLDNNLSYGFNISLNVPIYNRGQTRNNIQLAKLNAENNRLQYDQLLETLKITVQTNLADARAAKKKLEASEKALAAQQLAFENTSKRLELGTANTFEWEAQKTQMENAELQRLIDKYDYLFKIKILEFNLGKPLKL